MHLVRFRGPIESAWYKMLVGSGAEVVDYIPNYTYLVYTDANTINRLKAAKGAQGPIQWDGPYLDKYKITPDGDTMSKAKNGEQGLEQGKTRQGRR
jgi:hypothetical protein